MEKIINVDEMNRVLRELDKTVKESTRQVRNIFEDLCRWKNGKFVFTNKEVLEMLQINTCTLRRYRENGYLGYSKVGDKYFYTQDDIDKFLKNSHKEAFARR